MRGARFFRRLASSPEKVTEAIIAPSLPAALCRAASNAERTVESSAGAISAGSLIGNETIAYPGLGKNNPRRRGIVLYLGPQLADENP